MSAQSALVDRLDPGDLKPEARQPPEKQAQAGDSVSADSFFRLYREDPRLHQDLPPLPLAPRGWPRSAGVCTWRD
jgi:hypothetical protein